MLILKNPMTNTLKWYFELYFPFNFKLLTPETMKLLRSTERRISKEKNGKNVSQLEITEVVLVVLV